MKYILFAGDRYYPRGGWHDCKGVYESEVLALAAAASVSCEWWHIVEFNGDMYRTLREGEREWS